MQLLKVKTSLFILIIFTLFSCAKTPEAEIISAKREALYHLTHGGCDKAKSVLDSINPDSDDATYISLYASVYECKAGYKELDFISDLTSLDASSGNLLSTMASFSLAQVETTADSAVYKNLRQAIEIILAAGGGAQPSATNRISVFGERKAGDLHIQALLMITLELGKFVKYYSQAGTDGVKGAGGNACLAEYNDGNVVTFIGGLSRCNAATGLSQPEMELTDPEYERRFCEGITLFNNFQDILSNITFSSNSSDLGDLTNVSSVLDDIENQALTLDNTDGFAALFKDVTSQSVCESMVTNTSSDAHKGMQRFFAFIFEGFTE